MSATFCKSFSAFILAFVVFINSIGNFIGVGDIITTDPVEDTTTVTETITEADNLIPQSKEEIVAAFNIAVNSVKTDAKSVKRLYSKISLNGEAVIPNVINVALNSIGGSEKFINDQISRNSKSEETYTGNDIKNVYPVENENYASKLTVNDVKNAEIIEKDGQWVITIETFDDEKSAEFKHGEGHAPKAFNVVLPGVIDDNIPSILKTLVGPLTMNYPSSICTVTVDPLTGRAVTADYNLNWTIYFDKLGIIIPFSTNDYFSIIY